MNKVVFSVSKAGRSQSKLSGVGYIDGQSLYIPAVSKKAPHTLRCSRTALNVL